MAEPHLGPLKRFNTIEWHEKANVIDSLIKHPLSGYIGGNPQGGYWVERLTEEWKTAFGVKHAIPCNSATSGLLATCMAVNIKRGDIIWTTPYSMSATAACAKILGAKLVFIDIERDRFGIDPYLFPKKGEGFQHLGRPKAIIVTNLFGHPAHLTAIRMWCDINNIWMIEDNAQAPFAMEGEKYTGTIGHIGVFSLNVHKHIQSGEGGVIITNDHEIAGLIQSAINHGELADDPVYRMCTGLNLRMTEPIAAIACAQLAKADSIIEGRRQIGLALCDMVKDVPWIRAHVDQPGCKHVYYLWTALVSIQTQRAKLVGRLNAHGVPVRLRYAPLLHHLFKSNDKCPVAEDVDNHIIVFEVCAYDLRERHLKTMQEIIKRVTGEMDEIVSQRAL